jgi:hypothetical protein
MHMHMDNQAAIKQLKSEDSMASAKHVDIRIKFICDYARKCIVRPKYVESRLMKANLLTKAFPSAQDGGVAPNRQVYVGDGRGGVLEEPDPRGLQQGMRSGGPVRPPPP